jgi:hypothetical protein
LAGEFLVDFYLCGFVGEVKLRYKSVTTRREFRVLFERQDDEIADFERIDRA